MSSGSTGMIRVVPQRRTARGRRPYADVMRPYLTRSTIARLALYLGALSLLSVGADHIQQYYVDNYSAVPTIGDPPGDRRRGSTAGTDQREQGDLDLAEVVLVDEQQFQHRVKSESCPRPSRLRRGRARGR